jgi:hypothetical protein
LGEEYRSLSSSLCSFLHSTVTSSLKGPNILLNTPYSQTPPNSNRNFENEDFCTQDDMKYFKRLALQPQPVTEIS